MKQSVLRLSAALCLVAAGLSISSEATAQTLTLFPPSDTVVEGTTTDSAPLPTVDRLPSPPKSVTGAVADLLAPLPGDFKRFGSSQNWLIAGIGGVAATIAHPHDAQVAHVAWPERSVPVMNPGAMVGSFAAQSAVVLTTYAAGRISGSPRLTRVGAELFRAQMVSQATAQAIKFSVNRTRPDGTSLSFPSGHSASMFATATVLQSEFGWKVGAPAYAVASWVAASRIEAHRHFLSDVIAGATVGILAGRAVTFGNGNTRFAMGPMAVPGGIGLSLTKVATR
jgi:membrane-associated phospholipid phosphatase